MSAKASVVRTIDSLQRPFDGKFISRVWYRTTHRNNFPGANNKPSDNVEFASPACETLQGSIDLAVAYCQREGLEYRVTGDVDVMPTPVVLDDSSSHDGPRLKRKTQRWFSAESKQKLKTKTQRVM